MPKVLLEMVRSDCYAMLCAYPQACEDCLCALFYNAPGTPTLADDAPPPIDWAHWLALADCHRSRLPRLLPLVVEKQLHKMAALPVKSDDWKAAFVELGSGGLSADTWQLLCEGLVAAAVKGGVPSTITRWTKPGDLF